MAPPLKCQPCDSCDGEAETDQHTRSDKRTRGKEAQKRFREKSKQKFGGLEQEVHAMADRLRGLETEKAQLRAHINALQLANPGQPHPTPALPDIDRVEPPFMPAVSWANFNPEGNGGIILKTIYQQPRRLTRQQAEALSLEDMRSMLEEYVSKCGDMLVENPADLLKDSSSGPGAKLKELVTERRGLACSLAAWQPFKMLLLSERGFRRGASSTPAPTDYSSIVRRLELSFSQKCALHRAGRQYSDGFNALLSKREVLKSRLEEVTLEPAAHGGITHSDALAYAEAVRHLRDNTDFIYVQKSILWMTVLHMLEPLSYVQEARWWLELYPSFPDPASLYEELDRELHGQGVEAKDDIKPSVTTDMAENSPDLYVELVAKLMEAFGKVGMWKMLRNSETSDL